MHLRRLEEKQEINRLGQLLAERARIRHNLDHLLAQQQLVEESLTGALATLQLQQDLYRLQYLSQREESHIAGRLAQMDQRIQQQRQRLLEKGRERKSLEKLKDRALAQYNLDARREEAKENDDLNQNLGQWRQSQEGF